jgi:hypothetical protein
MRMSLSDILTSAGKDEPTMMRKGLRRKSDRSRRATRCRRGTEPAQMIR